MSLDVFIFSGPERKTGGSGIFVRQNGQTAEITEEEWERHFPGREPIRFIGRETVERYSGNLTHNLTRMAADADLYKPLWHPEQLGISTAGELIPLLEAGLTKLGADPERYRKFNPENGWGHYKDLVHFVESYLEACREWPDALVEVSR